MSRVHGCLLALLLVFMIGCSSLSEGTITDKVYHQAYSYERIQAVVGGTDTNYIPMTYYVPERYEFRIKKVVKGEMKEGHVNVSAMEYGKYEIGDWYPKVSTSYK